MSGPGELTVELDVQVAAVIAAISVLLGTICACRRRRDRAARRKRPKAPSDH